MGSGARTLVVGAVAVGVLALTLGAMATAVSGNAASIASSMALSNTIRAVNTSNFNVTMALCFGGALGVMGLLGGVGLACVVWQTRRNWLRVRRSLQTGMVPTDPTWSVTRSADQDIQPTRNLPAPQRTSATRASCSSGKQPSPRRRRVRLDPEMLDRINRMMD